MKKVKNIWYTLSIEARPYIVYRASVGTENWEVDHAGAVSVTYSVTASARKV